jgi:Ca-activated chloride channel family protein
MRPACSSLLPCERALRWRSATAWLVGAVLAAASLAGGDPTTATARDEPLPASLVLDFAPGNQVRTVMAATVRVPVSAVRSNQHGFYNLTLSGEVQVAGRVYDRFAYRYDVPVGQDPTLPLVLSCDRSLRPGSYRLLLTVEDLQGGRKAHLESDLRVPRLGLEEPLPGTPRLEEPFPGTPDRAATSATPAHVTTPLRSAPAIRLRPPPRVATGKQRFVASTSAEVREVAFLLDGRRVITRKRPPFEVELDLGSTATLRRLQVVAYDADGEAIGEHLLELNAGGIDRFAVRLARPDGKAQRAGRLTAAVDVAVPRGTRLDRLELFLDEQRLAVLHRPPFRREVSLAGSQPAVLRAVAYLGDGSAAEDSVLLNAPHAGQVDVELVELYATVVDGRGRPVRGLPASRFRVVEEGEQQRLERFAEVEDLPLHVALLIDTSASMTLRLQEVRDAALVFLRQIVTPRDRVTLITFDDTPRTRVGFTGDLAFLANGLEGLRANGGTALHDSLVFALEELSRIDGQRVLVLLSDGVDERSAASATDVLELARRSAATIYTVGLEHRNPRAPTLDRQLLTRLAEETGGRSFFAYGADGLRAAYDDIDDEVRSRYLLGYYSSHAGEQIGFRLVDLQVDGSRLTARTIRGYYP